jgi:hypothetical protein
MVASEDLRVSLVMLVLLTKLVPVDESSWGLTSLPDKPARGLPA